ncbi:MAG: MerR family transcriptional regulator [Peptococcaceae bacterium]|jgi:DNA-binding transcriptional MerR regulator|nr:MerR family transcriptional regulator [Peptococcaceae bacterium]
MNKNELMSISQFAKFTGVSRSALIFYDESGLFFPESRGDNGYRYYSPRQVVTINFVNTLRELNVPLKKIRELARERAPEDLVELLIYQEEIISGEMRQMREKHNVIATLLSTLQSGFIANEDAISVRFMPSTRINLGSENSFAANENFYDSFLLYCERAKEKGQNMCYPIGGHFDSAEIFRRAPTQPTHFFSLDPNGKDKKAAGRYLVGYSRCYYGESTDIVERIFAYAEEYGVKLEGNVYQIYLFDEISVRNHHEYLMQTAIRVADAPQPGKCSSRASKTMRAPENA